MRLRKRLVALLADHGLRLGPLGRAALADFIAIVVAEEAARLDDADDDDADEDEDDDDADDGAEDDDGSSADDDEDDEDDDAEEAVLLTRSIACPHCGVPLTIAIDVSGGDQDAIQDCEVCCSPIRVVSRVDGGKLVGFSAEPA